MIWRSNIDESRRAAFSECGNYRYMLIISWNSLLPRMASVGLNPSTADEFANDPTLARECTRASALGMGSLLKVNLFALRATNPKNMLAAEDPYGEWRQVHDIIRAIRDQQAASLVCATWGNHGNHRGRADAFRSDACRLGLELSAYALNKGNQEPRHILYSPYSLLPVPYEY